MGTSRWKALLSLLFAFALVAAACGDSDDDEAAAQAVVSTVARPEVEMRRQVSKARRASCS